MTHDQTLQILDHLVASLGSSLGDINERIRELERSSGLTVLDEMPMDPKSGTLAKSRGGLWQFSDGKWNVIGNGIHAVDVRDTASGAVILIEETDGTRIEKALTFAKPRPRKQPVKLAA